MLVTAAVAAVLAMAALGATRYLGPEAADARVSNEGTPIEPSALDRRILRMGGYKHEIKLLEPSGGHRFARVERLDGTECFATSVRPDQTQLGIIRCDPKFPAERSVLDFSVYGADRGSEMGVVRVLGIAADGVAEVRVVSSSGTVLRAAPVLDNAYVLDETDLRGLPAHSIVAVDGSGETVERFGP